uniref:Acetyltransferase (GNAT) domain-containing protein n=1 Tax=Candidatus Kentrum sp. TUN TaxID=2126343 RepID=A0A451A0Z1_9GAMM|nr:MAG: hypothetical protein BECKTUN1418D_GA0071000_11071 [Candidatus Kentron sp. TUN]
MLKVQSLTGDHDRNGFNCSVDSLNLWLRKTARQHQAKGISRTFVAPPASLEAVMFYRACGFSVPGGFGSALFCPKGHYVLFPDRNRHSSRL